MASILYLTPKSLYDSKMSIGRRLYVQSLSDAGCRVTITGPGWDGWNGNLGKWLDQQRVYHEPDPDVIIAYKTEGIPDVGKHGIPVACIFNEANDYGKTIDDLHATQATDVFFHHAGDYAAWMPELSRMGKQCHLIYHCAQENPFALNEFEKRPIKFGIAGVLSREIYPVRDAFARSGICRVRKHPGYRIADVQAQYLDYQKWLSDVQVLICCTSKYQYPLAKITEGLAAGCLVVSDMPNCPFLKGVSRVGMVTPDDVASLIRDSAYASKMVPRLEGARDLVIKGQDKPIEEWKRKFTLAHWANNFLAAMKVKV